VQPVAQLSELEFGEKKLTLGSPKYPSRDLSRQRLLRKVPQECEQQEMQRTVVVRHFLIAGRMGSNLLQMSMILENPGVRQLLAPTDPGAAQGAHTYRLPDFLRDLLS
jgi:hypothetical protein